MKPSGDKATDFHNKVISKVYRLAVISLYSALSKDKNQYLQVFLNECKYIEKEKKVIRHINDDLMDFFYFDDADEQ